jgi:hypothetical protein
MSATPKKEYTGFMAYVVAAREIKCSSASKKCLLQYYASNVNKDGSFFRSMLDICAETSLAESFVRKTNTEWEAKKILKCIEGNWRDGKANVYILSLPVLQQIARSSRSIIDKAKDVMRDKATKRMQKYRAKKKLVTPLESATNDSVTPQCDAVAVS